jgi:hypothetical protein
MFSLRLLSISIIIFIAAACTEKEQAKKDDAGSEMHQHGAMNETRSSVPELASFHEVIYQIWHKAWPAKDIQLLKELIPDIEEGFTKLSRATLPGILRDKQDDWSAGIKTMEKIIASYKTAAAADQKTALLKAAEDLHTQFENLMRMVRPVMTEVDVFHQELYMLYHYYMPDYDLEKIRVSTAELVSRMEPIKQAQLPPRRQDKQKAFDQRKQSLSGALAELEQAVKNDPGKDSVIQAIEKVHDQYRALVAVFE